MKIRKRAAGKILSVSFWLIALAHIVAFTAVGLFTGAGWRLLLVFLAALPVVALVKIILTKILKK